MLCHDALLVDENVWGATNAALVDVVDVMAIPMLTSNGQCRHICLMTVSRVCGEY